MAKQDAQTGAERASRRVVYARFHVPVQFIGLWDGVRNDTSQMRGAELSVSAWGLEIGFRGRAILVGWPNLQFVEVEPSAMASRGEVG